MKQIIATLVLSFFIFAVFAQQRINDFYLSNYKDDGNRDWEIIGKEAVVNDKYVDIDKMEAFYYSKDKKITVKSDKAKIDKETKDVVLTDNVEVNIPADSQNTINVTCEGPLEMLYEKGIATFSKNVVVDSKEGKLFSDKATVFFDKDSKKLVKIVAEGNVKIIKDDNVTFAKKATYFADEKRIILEGNPRVIYFPKESKN